MRACVRARACLCMCVYVFPLSLCAFSHPQPPKKKRKKKKKVHAGLQEVIYPDSAVGEAIDGEIIGCRIPSDTDQWRRSAKRHRTQHWVPNAWGVFPPAPPTPSQRPSHPPLSSHPPPPTLHLALIPNELVCWELIQRAASRLNLAGTAMCDVTFTAHHHARLPPLEQT